MPQFVGSVSHYPARALLIWYIGLIVVGTALLMLPISQQSGRSDLSWADAVFTATSAACVTGLAVRSTAHDFSFTGQAVILVLLQLGGLGIMTVTTFVMLHWGGRESIRQKVLLAETIGAKPADDIRQVLAQIVRLTLVIEAAGFLLLTARFLFDHSFSAALWHAVFHSVSAFCNAGFALADDSLTRYQGDPFVNLTIMLLIVSGGLGFPVFLDLRQHWHKPWAERWHRLSLHSKLILLGTASLLVLGTVAFLLLEWNGSLARMSLGRKLLVASFQSVTTRTAGFNTIAIGGLHSATIFVMILLMMIGASPCSTGGGFKVSTFAVLALHAWSKLRGAVAVNVFKRSVSREHVDKSVATVLLFAVTGTLGLMMLLVLHGTELAEEAGSNSFLDAMFEVVSAVGTVGLSTGFTANLALGDKWLIILLMLIGRIGPVSIVVALARESRSKSIEYPKGSILIG